MVILNPFKFLDYKFITIKAISGIMISQACDQTEISFHTINWKLEIKSYLLYSYFWIIVVQEQIIARSLKIVPFGHIYFCLYL